MLCAHTNLVRDSIFSGGRPIFSISHSALRPAKYTRKYLHPAPFRLRDIPPPLPPPISVMRLSQCILLLCLAHQQGKKGRAKFIHARYRMDFFKTLSIEEQRRRYQKIPRFALIPLKLSPWQKLLHSRNDQAFITMMGFDAESFDRILVKFGPIFSEHTPFHPNPSVG